MHKLNLFIEKLAQIKFIHYLSYWNKGTIMARERKYKVGCSGSGWGIWEIATGNKVASFGRSRYAALDAWYELEGWKKPAVWY